MKKALVVDDNSNNLTLEKDLLEVAGFQVFVAENATSGIAIARKEETGHHYYGRTASGYARYRSCQYITSRQRDKRYPHYFCDCFGNGRGNRRDKKYN